MNFFVDLCTLNVYILFIQSFRQRQYTMILDFATPPSPALYNHVRAGLIAKGDTLGQWARRNGESLQMVKASLVGNVNSPKAKGICKAVIQEIEAGKHDKAS